jgi:3-oxoacyl-[acyl-carrier protein] reductase
MPSIEPAGFAPAEGRKAGLMDQKVAVITGGARGIGRAVAVALADRGWAVVASYRQSAQLAGSLEAELRSRGKTITVVQADASDPAAAQELVRRAEAVYGRVDALINGAGSYHRIPILEESDAGWRAMFDDNLHTVFNLSRAAAPGMIGRRWGRIVNFSIAKADQLVGQPFITAHYIAKVGVLILTRSLAKTLAPHGITVNSISPGFIESESSPQQEFAQLIKNIPAGYAGAPQDAVSAVTYLLSDEARYINGTNIHVSGAWGI